MHIKILNTKIDKPRFTKTNLNKRPVFFAVSYEYSFVISIKYSQVILKTRTTEEIVIGDLHTFSILNGFTSYIKFIKIT